jgi:hypothetical protein
VSPRIILSLLLSVFLVVRLSGAADPSDELQTFYGEVKAIDLAAKTITLKSGGKRYIFHVTDETKISGRNGYIRLEKVEPGQVATVVMRPGEAGVRIAVRIRFDASAELASFIELYSLKTTQGETISGMAFNNYVAYQPPDDAWTGSLDYGARRSSLFLLLVRPDGSVTDAKPLHGLGYAELDARAVKWLKKWRFRPNSVAEVRMPIGNQRMY